MRFEPYRDFDDLSPLTLRFESYRDFGDLSTLQEVNPKTLEEYE